jgi:hypothetical protein
MNVAPNALSLACVVLALAAFPARAGADIPGKDPRSLQHGRAIPDEGYCDQPYVVVTPAGDWLCVLTTGKGIEGQMGQHVVSTRSKDRGQTWSKLVDIEPADGPEASWVVPLLTPGGRVYAFYDYNGDHVDSLGGKKIRADMLGWFVYKYSDDFGQTWSKERYRLPMRRTSCDHGNDWQGRVQIFWGICKPQVAGREVLFSFTKLGKYMLDQGEGWVYRSDNILTETDVTRLRWDLWPDGDHGIRAAAFGSVQEEHNLVWLGGSRWYCAYRTTRGHPCQSYSSDGGKTWEVPGPMTYTPGGKLIKHPRACPKLWRTAAGKYLFWFHNHGGTTFQERNPAWIAGGVVKDGRLVWSQPEILFYDPDPTVRMSYPDLIEQDGRYWITETQKTVARVHEVDQALLEGLWQQGQNKAVAEAGRLLDLNRDHVRAGDVAVDQRLDLQQAAGLSLDLWIKLNDVDAGQVLLDNRDAQGRGLALTTTAQGTIRIELSDGTTKAAWDCDRGLLGAGKLHHVVVIVDAGPRILSFVVDGVLCDGGAHRPYGWTRWQGTLGDVSGTGKLRLAPALRGELYRLRVYDRFLRTSEAVAHFQAGPD